MEAVPQFLSAYRKSTPQRIKLIDLFLTYIVLTGAIQFVYCCLVGTFPFNSFLSGFISCVGSFILTVNLRVQTINANNEFAISEERAFADFLFCQVILHLVVMNFLG